MPKTHLAHPFHQGAACSHRIIDVFPLKEVTQDGVELEFPPNVCKKCKGQYKQWARPNPANIYRNYASTLAYALRITKPGVRCFYPNNEKKCRKKPKHFARISTSEEYHICRDHLGEYYAWRDRLRDARMFQKENV